MSYLINFNPRSLVGNDRTSKVDMDKLNKFQSTFPRGERQTGSCDLSSVQPFQSTFPRGERQFVPVNNSVSGIISIHVPSWGTTQELSAKVDEQEFQSTFPRGERRLGQLGIRKPSKFQSTFPRGERLNASIQTNKAWYFNPRSLVGNDRI